MLRRDIELVFRPDLAASYESQPAGCYEDLEDYLGQRLLAVPTWQPAKQDLSEISFAVNEERRGLLATFHEWVAAVRARLGDHWSDASDPLEGTALFGARTSCIYNELEGLTTLLRYDSVPIGCCGIVLHPVWQRRAYPVTFFTTAPLDVLKAALSGAEADRATRFSAAQLPSEDAETLQLGESAVCTMPRGGALADADRQGDPELDGAERVELDASLIPWLETPLSFHTKPAVHFDAQNLPLLTALAESVRSGDAVLYHGCGCGVLGLLALRAGAASVHFTDVEPTAVDLAAANARAAGFRQGKHWTAAVADLRTAAAASSAGMGMQYDLMLCNPPQLAGPPAMQEEHADRYGGPAGILYYQQLVSLVASQLRPGGRVALLQTSLSSFAAVDALFAAQGLVAATVATQPRSTSAAALEQLAPGTLAWLLALRDRGAADFNTAASPEVPATVLGGPDTQQIVQYTQRLVVCADAQTMRQEARTCA